MIKKTLKINGVERILILDKDETLAQVLRNHLLLTGCKIGCGEGHCGACNVIMNGKVTFPPKPSIWRDWWAATISSTTAGSATAVTKRAPSATTTP